MALVAHGGSRARDAGGLLNDMVTRFMGLIVIAMGVQFALTGFHNFFG
jgi:small neutral amino acid transporter SnatA (MarC family)